MIKRPLTPEKNKRRGDRHKPGYMAAYMRKRRARLKECGNIAGWTHTVLVPIPATGRIYQPGELVNAAEWRNREALERQRFIKPIWC